MTIREESLKKHYEWQGKIEVVSRVSVENREDLSLCYTPGVAEPCLAIKEDINRSYDLTRRSNLVAVITDGTAVLGLGDIGPEAGMPVMEGKCALFKEFADVDAFPICIKSKDVDELVRTIYLISGSFGGINLEDIAAPRCFEVEKRLKEICDIPVFHDDQHGTAVVTLAALVNALKLVDKKMSDIRVVMNGAGAAGVAIARLLLSVGVGDVLLCDRKGIICKETAGSNKEKLAMIEITNHEHRTGSLADAMRGADVFVGVSKPDLVTPEMVRSMAEKPVLFPMANPNPEITYELAKESGAYIVGTGRSDYPNQINNVLVFPGIFKGALSCRAKAITEEMKLAAAYAIAKLVPEDKLSPEYIIPSALDKSVAEAVARAVADEWNKSRL